MSADFDKIIQQERETDSIAITELKEYLKSKLDESCEQAKSETYKWPINVPDNLEFFDHMSYCWEQQSISQSQLESLLEESKTKISKLDVESVLEALRINFAAGFIAACQYILNPPIITPKPYSEMPQNKLIL